MNYVRLEPRLSFAWGSGDKIYLRIRVSPLHGGHVAGIDALFFRFQKAAQDLS